MTQPEAHPTVKLPAHVTALQYLQLAAILFGIWAIAMSQGRSAQIQDQHGGDLRELKAIVSDLVKAQISLSKDREQDGHKLEDLEQRMRVLEGEMRRRVLEAAPSKDHVGLEVRAGQ